MKAVKKAAVVVVAACAVGIGFASSAATASAQSAGRLSAAEQAGLSFSREEERMARELYTLFADRYDTGPFARISTSEQRHFDAIGALLSEYGVADPSAGATPGVYADATLQGVYDAWKADGFGSLQAAYEVGVELEQRDIDDLQRLQAATSNADLDRVYARLENGSEHHLAAFSAAANGDPVSEPATRAQRTGRGAGACASRVVGSGTRIHLVA